jgi:hypothetical protein
MKNTVLIIGMFILIVASAGCSARYYHYPTNTSDPQGCALGLTNCSRSCKDLQIDRWNCGSRDYICPAGLDCIQGICQCKPGYKFCDLGCANLQNDETNCGECRRVCSSNEYCSHGSCVWRTG